MNQPSPVLRSLNYFLPQLSTVPFFPEAVLAVCECRFRNGP